MDYKVYGQKIKYKNCADTVCTFKRFAGTLK